MKVSPQELGEIISNFQKPILVEFWSSWCLPCQTAGYVLEKIKEEYKEQLKVVKINLDINPNISSQYKIKGLPTFALFFGGKEVDRAVGAKSEADLHKMIDYLLDGNKKNNIYGKK